MARFATLIRLTSKDLSALKNDYDGRLARLLVPRVGEIVVELSVVERDDDPAARRARIIMGPNGERGMVEFAYEDGDTITRGLAAAAVLSGARLQDSFLGVW